MESDVFGMEMFNPSSACLSFDFEQQVQHMDGEMLDAQVGGSNWTEETFGRR